MKPWLESPTFIDRHKTDIDLATAAFRKARLAREQGDEAESKKFTELADRMMDRIEQLYEQETKAKPK